MSAHPNWFAVLGIEKNATVVDIEQAYQNFSIQYENDKNNIEFSSEEVEIIDEEFLLMTHVKDFLIKRITGSKNRIQRIKPLERKQPLIFKELDRSIAEIEASLPRDSTERHQWNKKFSPIRQSIELILDDF